MEKPFAFAYGFKAHCTSINERFSKLEGCLRSIRKIKIKKFPPFGNELLSPSKHISLTACLIMHPSKQKYICDYYHRCIISSGLLFDDIIMNIIRNKKLAHPIEENDCLFTQIENHTIYMYRGHFNTFSR